MEVPTFPGEWSPCMFDQIKMVEVGVVAWWHFSSAYIA